MKLGLSNISKIYVGAKEVIKAYLGSTQVYPTEVSTLWTPAQMTTLAWYDAADEETVLRVQDSTTYSMESISSTESSDILRLGSDWSVNLLISVDDEVEISGVSATIGNVAPADINGLRRVTNVILTGEMLYTFEIQAGATATSTDSQVTYYTATRYYPTDQVYEWQDKSGNVRHVLQGTAARQPIKSVRDGKNIIEFNNNFLRTVNPASWLNNTSFSIIAVLQYDNLKNYSYFLGTVSLIANKALCIGTGNSSSTLQMAFYFNDALYPYTWTTNTSMLSCLYKSPASEIFVNGASIGTNLKPDIDLSTEGQFNIGSGYFTDGRNDIIGAINEIVIFTGNSIIDRQKLEGYLAHKWDLSANLPVDHPYKLTAP